MAAGDGPTGNAQPTMRRARVGAAALVGTLVAVGTSTVLAAGSGSVGRDLGMAILSGGIVGGALVTVETMLASAADRRSTAASLRLLLSSTVDLNGIDLSGEQLAGQYLPGRALVAANLSGANLAETKLLFADLRFANLANANLRGADLRGATLVGADLTGADLSGALLDDADLSDADLYGATLHRVSATDARAERTRFGTASVTGATFENIYLGGARLANVRGRLILVGASYDDATTWPPTFAPPPSSDVHQESIADMDLATYLAYRLRKDRRR